MKTETMNERVQRLNKHIENGTLLRKTWGDGHERACLLAALAPETAAEESASACPVEVMSMWLAELTPWMDDCGSDDAWPAMVRRYAQVAARWHVLDDAAWERARIASLIVIVEEARSHCPDDAEAAIVAIDKVLDWLRRGAPGGEAQGLSDEARAAGDAAWAAAWAAGDAAWATVWAARAARAAGADRLTAGILGAIEAECNLALSQEVSE